ncbi:MAG: hypothetical protein SFX72_10925 [Isosphaeraceae bacterium]|nr:hypothetical protein [Isosphaeraceae bacterium]
MNPEQNIDMIRWTFRVEPEKAQEIEDRLVEIGMDVSIYDDGTFQTTWDEPDRELDSVVEEIWTLNGSPFDITQESFQRTSLLVYHTEEVDEEEADPAEESA